MSARQHQCAASARAAQLRAQIELVVSAVAREQLEGRLARLIGRVALLKVGGPTELELKEKLQC